MYNVAFSFNEEFNMKAVVKVCPKHGDLTEDNICKRIDSDGYNYINCRFCRREENQKSYQRNKEKRLAEAAVYRSQNREKLAEWQRNDRRNNKEKYKLMYQTDHYYQRKLRQLVKKRGLTMGQYEQMIESQNNLCAICEQPEIRKEPRDNQITRLCIDHCHSTGKSRALLCHKCNSALGKFDDNPEYLIKAAKYVSKWKKKHAEAD